MPIPVEVEEYNASHVSPAQQRVCGTLAGLISAHLRAGDGEEIACRVWHGHPVWFIEGNPIVGYSDLAGGKGSEPCIRLMFWSGQSFDEPELAAEPPETKFKSAGVRLRHVDEIDTRALKRWLKKAAAIQWDYKNLVKRKGRLERLR